MSAPKAEALRADGRAERAVLGSVLLDPEALATVAAVLSPADFGWPSHGSIFEGMLALEAKGTAVDIVTLRAELQRRGRLEAIGGAQYLGDLSESVATTAHVESYAAIVRDLAAVRRALAGARAAVAAATDPAQSPAQVFEVLQRAADAAATDHASRAGGPVDLSDAIGEAFHAIENPDPAKAPLPTGIEGLDRMLEGGFRGGQLAILAARPGVGKSGLAAQVALNVARTSGQAVLFCSLEMPRLELTHRLLAGESGVELGRLRSGRLGPDDMAALLPAGQRLYGAPLLIDARAELRASELRVAARHIARKRGLGMIVVDYLQLMKASTERDSREREVAEQSRALKSLALELNVPVLALSQLNRSPETRAKDKRPQLSDLRESGAIEQDADVVLFIYREHAHDKRANPETAELIIAKQRNGPTGTVPLRFDGARTRFEDAPEDAAPQRSTREDSGEWAVDGAEDSDAAE